VTEVIPFHLLFGASSSQAVHPDRNDPKDRARKAAAALLNGSRDLVLVAREQGAQTGGSRQHFGDAKAALDASRYQDSARLSGRAVRAAAETMGPAGANLLDAFELFFAMCAAEACGADIREPMHLFHGADAELRSPESPFGPAWQALGRAIAGAGDEAASRYRETVTGLGGSSRVLSVTGGK
jgi:hypothetical protein